MPLGGADPDRSCAGSPGRNPRRGSAGVFTGEKRFVATPADKAWDGLDDRRSSWSSNAPFTRHHWFARRPAWRTPNRSAFWTATAGNDRRDGIGMLDLWVPITRSASWLLQTRLSGRCESVRVVSRRSEYAPPVVRRGWTGSGPSPGHLHRREQPSGGLLRESGDLEGNYIKCKYPVRPLTRSAWPDGSVRPGLASRRRR